jgi:hypothetical protein
MTSSLQLRDRSGNARGVSPVVPQPDPPIEAGAFKAYRRVDGKIAIVDNRRHFADRTIKLFTSEDAARRAVTELARVETP